MKIFSCVFFLEVLWLQVIRLGLWSTLGCFLCKVRGQGPKLIVLHVDFTCLSSLLERLFFLPLNGSIVKNQLTINVLVYFRTLICSIDLCPCPHSVDHCCFRVSFGVGGISPPPSFLRFMFLLSPLGPLPFHVNCMVSLSISATQTLLGFGWEEGFEAVAQFGETCRLIHIESSNTWRWSISSFTQLSLFSFSRTTVTACQIVSCGPHVALTLLFFLFFPVCTSVQMISIDSLFTSFIFCCIQSVKSIQYFILISDIFQYCNSSFCNSTSLMKSLISPSFC